MDDAGAAVDARTRFVAFVRTVTGRQDFRDRTELVFGELLGNVVRHAPGPVEISVDVDANAIVLHVVDTGPPLPHAKRRLPDDLLSERGRGLFIVEQLADDVSVERVGGCGNHITVTMKP